MIPEQIILKSRENCPLIHMILEWEPSVREYLKTRDAFVQPRYELDDFVKFRPDFLNGFKTQFKLSSLGILFGRSLPLYSAGVYHNILSHKYTQEES